MYIINISCIGFITIMNSRSNSNAYVNFDINSFKTVSFSKNIKSTLKPYKNNITKIQVYNGF